MPKDDSTSIFSYDGHAEPHSFSLDELRTVVTSHFSTVCSLEKLAEGGNHKVYEVFQESGASLGVVRVASPDFPRDKLESEVATLKFLAAHTQVPVPEVYAWNSDASNPVGAEYVIMQKISGVPASEKWETLPMNLKEHVVSQVAEHLMSMFATRFDHAGSLYLSPSSESDFVVGPIVSEAFYRALDGSVRVPGADETTFSHLSCYRGPFSNTSHYLQSSVLAELDFISRHRSIALSEINEINERDKEQSASRLEHGERVLRKVLELCLVYPGDNQIYEHMTTLKKPFSLRLTDFRLSNLMINEETGRVTGIIDFEGTTISPLWECALLPRWLQDPDDHESSYEGGPEADRRPLREVFWEKMRNEEWRALYERGKAFRGFAEQLECGIAIWAELDMESWVAERLVWAKEHPGVGFPEIGSDSGVIA